MNDGDAIRVEQEAYFNELNNGANKRRVCTFKYRSTFNPYAGTIPVRFYGFNLSHEAEQVRFTTPQEDGANVRKVGSMWRGKQRGALAVSKLAIASRGKLSMASVTSPSGNLATVSN